MNLAVSGLDNSTAEQGAGVVKVEVLYSYYLRLLWQQQRAGHGCLPNHLGLYPLNFIWLSQRYLQSAHDVDGLDRGTAEGELREELLQMRRDEWQELRELLMQHRAHRHVLEVALAEIVAAGCMGGDHLWRDLGFTDRRQLSDLITLAFPELAARNNADMKWKKFFYRQLCEEGGHFVCRSPSCEACAAYHDCFGPEN